MQMCSEDEERTHLSSIGDSDTSLVEDGCMHAPLPTSGLDCMDAVSGMMDDGRDGMGWDGGDGHHDGMNVRTGRFCDQNDRLAEISALRPLFLACHVCPPSLVL